MELNFPGLLKGSIILRIPDEYTYIYIYIYIYIYLNNRPNYIYLNNRPNWRSPSFSQMMSRPDVFSY